MKVIGSPIIISTIYPNPNPSHVFGFENCKVNETKGNKGRWKKTCMICLFMKSVWLYINRIDVNLFNS
jgi:hypothetical protein